MILALKRFSRYFVDKVPEAYNGKVKKKRRNRSITATKSPTEKKEKKQKKKTIGVLLFFMLTPRSNFKILSLTVLDCMQSVILLLLPVEGPGSLNGT